jgi:DNA modification methylase
MTKKTKTAESETAPTTPTTVIGKKHVRRKYSLGDDYREWKKHCDDLKLQSAFHSSEATRYRNEHKKCYENGADGFCNARDDREWGNANNLITIAAMKESERANSSQPGENVLEIFGGSGSTLIACEQTERKCYCMELDELYCDIIVRRWEEFTGKKAERITQKR